MRSPTSLSVVIVLLGYKMLRYYRYNFSVISKRPTHSRNPSNLIPKILPPLLRCSLNLRGRSCIVVVSSRSGGSAVS